MSEILKKEGIEEVDPQKRETRSQISKTEESKEAAEDESQGEEDLEHN
jgi:hypothetical protein